MRNLFLVLVLANLAFAAWHTWFAPQAASALVAEPDVPTLELTSEVEQTDEPAGGQQSSTPGASTAARGESPEQGRCVSVGPFRELAQAAAAASTLRSSGFEPSQRVAEGDIWVGHWVFIEDIATRAEANEILATLRENGLTEPYLIPDTDRGNVISLGVYSETAGAERRGDRVRALGFAVTVTDRTRRGTVYWVDVRLAADRSIGIDALQPQGRIIRLEQRPCASVRS